MVNEINIANVSKSYSVVEVWPHETLKEIKILRVEFPKGISVEIMNLGGVIRAIEVPDRNGIKENIVLNYGPVNKYFQNSAYLGCIVGRYANRIKNGSFSLNGKLYQLSCNEGQHHLHGGYEGFSRKVWHIKSLEEREEEISITLAYHSKDGEEGYPGNLDVLVKYILTKDSLTIEYKAKSEEDTVFNPTNHSYFNLSGNFESTINDHWLKIQTSQLVDTDADLIPTGIINQVEGSVFDFNDGKVIGEHPFDVCYALELGPIVMTHEQSGRQVEVETTFPGLQLYTGDHLVESGFNVRSGICLETQFYPDSPNHKEFPDVVLRKGQSFSHQTAYHFSTL